MKQLREWQAAPRVIRRGRRGAVALCVLLFAGFTCLLLAQGPAARKDLRQVYQQECARCHGDDGAARSATGKRLRGEDLTDAAWRKRTSDEEMVKVILKGKFFGWAMPGYRDVLTQDEAQRMVTEIIRKSKRGEVIEPERDGPGKDD